MPGHIQLQKYLYLQAQQENGMTACQPYLCLDFEGKKYCIRLGGIGGVLSTFGVLCSGGEIQFA